MDTLHLIKKTDSYLIQNSENEIVSTAILAKRILNDIEKIIQPGISESEAIKTALLIFKKYGIAKLWHRPLIRFNQNTLCTFKDRPTQNYILKEEDIAFIDIGIVKNDIEGDVGKTIVFGQNKELLHLKNTSERLFDEAIRFWKTNNPTGVKLYEFIYEQAKKNDVIFNLSPAGHLIGSFPHTHAWTKGINTYPAELLPKGWILEIQIKSQTLPFGAFYEDLLF